MQAIVHQGREIKYLSFSLHQSLKSTNMVQRFFVFAICLMGLHVAAQKQNDVVTPLHALQPDYPIPYSVPSKESVKKVLDRIYTYLDAVTPMQFANRTNNQL